MAQGNVYHVDAVVRPVIALIDVSGDLISACGEINDDIQVVLSAAQIIAACPKLQTQLRHRACCEVRYRPVSAKPSNRPEIPIPGTAVIRGRTCERNGALRRKHP